MKRLALFLSFFTIAYAQCASNYERFEENGKMGIKDEQGHVVLPASFDALGWSDGSFSLIGQITGFRHGDRWGLLNLKKEFLTKAVYQTLTYPGGDRVVVSRPLNPYTVKYGSINLKGELTIPFWYDEIRIHDLRAIVMIKNGLQYEYGLIDLNNRTILPLRYKKITPLGTLRYAVQDFSDKSALCSEEGKWSTGFDIDSLSTFQHGYAIIHRGWQQGLINRSGEVKIEPIYREIIVNDSTIRTRRAHTWKVIDLQQRDLQQVEADELVALAINRNRITLSGKSGLVDASFKPILSMRYDYISPIENEMVVVRKNGKYGLLRTNEAVVLPISFDSLVVSGHLVRASKKVEGQILWDLLDTVGVRKTKTSYEWIGPYNGKFFPARKNGFIGGVDRLGMEQIACVYDSILEINEDIISVKFQGQYGIITLDDRWKLSPQRNRLRLLSADRFLVKHDSLEMMMDFEGQIIYFTDHPIRIFPTYLLEEIPAGTEREINFLGQIVTHPATAILPTKNVQPESEALVAIQRDGKFGFVDNQGRLRIANRYEGAGDFKEGLAPVQLLSKWGFIDPSDKIIVQPILDIKSAFHNGMAIVRRNGKVGLMNRQGSILLEMRYDSIHRLGDDAFILHQNSLMGLADAAGRVLIEPRFQIIEKAGTDHVIVKQDDKFGLLTLDGLSVFPLRYYQLVYFTDTGLFFVCQQQPWETMGVK